MPFVLLRGNPPKRLLQYKIRRSTVKHSGQVLAMRRFKPDVWDFLIGIVLVGFAWSGGVVAVLLAVVAFLCTSVTYVSGPDI